MTDLFIFMVIVIQQGMSQTMIPYWVGNCFKEKKDLIQFGLHQAIHYWNQKMSRATKMPVFDFAQQQLPESWASLFHPKARIVTWPALSNDFLHLTIKNGFFTGTTKVV